MTDVWPERGVTSACRKKCVAARAAALQSPRRDRRQRSTWDGMRDDAGRLSKQKEGLGGPRNGDMVSGTATVLGLVEVDVKYE